MERVEPSGEIKNFTPLGAMLREARVSKGRSVRGVARSAGISAVYLSTLEHGINPKTGKPSNPSLEVRDRLFSVLNITAGRVDDASTDTSSDTAKALNSSRLSIMELNITSAYERGKAVNMVRDGLFDVDGPNNEFNYYIALANLYGSAAVAMQVVVGQLDKEVQELRTKYHIQEDQVVNKPEDSPLRVEDPRV